MSSYAKGVSTQFCGCRVDLNHAKTGKCFCSFSFASPVFQVLKEYKMNPFFILNIICTLNALALTFFFKKFILHLRV